MGLAAAVKKQEPQRSADVVQLRPEQPKKPQQQRGVKMVAPEVGKMAYGIRAYMTKDGVRYLGQVRVVGFAKERESFVEFADAYSWQTNRVKALKQGAIQRKDDKFAAGPGEMMLTGVDGLLMRYADSVQASDEPMPESLYNQYLRLAGCSKAQIKGTQPRIKSLQVRVVDLDGVVLTAFCDERKKQGVAPSSALDEYSRISTALKSVAFANKWFTWVNPMTATIRAALFAKGKLAESDPRNRRLEVGEFPAMIEWFKAWEAKEKADRPRLVKQRADNERYGKTHQHALPQIPPMADIITLAVMNGPRRSTTLGMRWSQFDAQQRQITVLVKDKKGEYQADSRTRRRETSMPIIPVVAKIIERQPRIAGEDRIFPYADHRIQAVWQMMKRALKAKFPSIVTLRFHDLRHEAATTILEAVKGDHIKAMRFTTHKTFRHFQRYVTHGKKDIKNMADLAGANMQLPQ